MTRRPTIESWLQTIRKLQMEEDAATPQPELEPKPPHWQAYSNIFPIEVSPLKMLEFIGSQLPSRSSKSLDDINNYWAGRNAATVNFDTRKPSPPSLDMLRLSRGILSAGTLSTFVFRDSQEGCVIYGIKIQYGRGLFGLPSIIDIKYSVSILAKPGEDLEKLGKNSTQCYLGIEATVRDQEDEGSSLRLDLAVLNIKRVWKDLVARAGIEVVRDRLSQACLV